VSIRFRTVCAAAALAPLALLAACGSSGSTASSTTSASAAPAASSGSGATTLSETGSTLMFPLFGSWQTAYSTAVPTVTITSGGTGSGTGIADASTGTVTIGASDAYLSPSDISQNPGLINIPLTVAAVMVNYNVPGVSKPLDLNGKVLAKIYDGKITNWNDPAIAALNPGVKLPSLKIVTVHRADSSGSTFLFTS
jgi:phosphate transport system substrate-binding protein